MGKCSVFGTILCRDAKSNIVAIAAGGPMGEPEILRSASRIGKILTGMFSVTTLQNEDGPLGQEQKSKLASLEVHLR